MTKSFVHAAALALLLLMSGCGVLLTGFVVPAQAPCGAVMFVTISGDITGSSGEAGCVLQLPNGWNVVGQTSSPVWPVARDNPALLANYVAEPGHYLVGFSGTGQSGGMGSPTTLSHIDIHVSVLVPVAAQNQTFVLKTSLAGNGAPWQIMEPVGIAQFAQITAAPYARPISIGAPANIDFMPAEDGLPTAPSFTTWTGAACDDIDGDGADDLAATRSGSRPRCWLSRPGGTWIERSPTVGPVTGNARVAFGHLDPDPHLDFVDGNGNVYFGDGGTTWTLGAPLQLAIAGTWYVSVATGDVDGDGLDDIAIAAPGRLQVLLNNGNRTFRDASGGLPAGSGGSVGNLRLVDVTGEGHLDLLWANSLSPVLWLGDGLGGWTVATGIPVITCVAAADIDGDGLADVIGAHGSGISVFKYAGGANWAVLPVAGLPTGVSFTAVAALDYDRDGHPDIVGGRPSLGGLSPGQFDLCHHTGTGFVFVPSTTSGLPSFINDSYFEITVGDFDGNTFPDLVTLTSPGLSPSGGASQLKAYQDQRTGVAPFGSGCNAPSVAAPVLASVSAPQRGNSAFAMQVLQAPGAFAAFWFGPSRTSAPPFALPLDLAFVGAPGCTLWAAPEVIYTGFLGPAGDFTIALPVPNDPFFTFVTVYAQGSVFTTANPFGMVLSAGSAIRIQ